MVNPDIKTKLMACLSDENQFGLVMGLLESVATGEIEDTKTREEAVQAKWLQPNSSIDLQTQTDLLAIANKPAFQSAISSLLAKLGDSIAQKDPEALQILKTFRKRKPNLPLNGLLRSLVREYKFYMRLQEMGISGSMLPYIFKMHTHENYTWLAFKVLNRDPVLVQDPLLIRKQQLKIQPTDLEYPQAQESQTERKKTMSTQLTATQTACNRIKSALGVDARTQLYLDPKNNLVYRPLNGLDIDPAKPTNILVPFTTAQKLGSQVKIVLPGTQELHVLDRIG